MVKILREMSHGQHIPIIVYGYKRWEGRQEKVLNAGASYFMAKPSEKFLLRKIRRFLENKL